MRLGVIIPFNGNIQSELEKVRSLELPTCQVSAGGERLFNDEMVERFKRAIDATGVEVTTFWAGWPGPAVWDLVDGPNTLGLVPPIYQYVRVEVLKKASDFARAVGIDSITTHVGFIPDNPYDPLYSNLLIALKTIVAHCKSNGQMFCFETGQETPVTLLRTIEDLGTDNLGINLDPANLLMYGKANPIDALDVFGQYVQGVHAKDGEYPTNGRKLGLEKPLGQGRVNYPAFIAKLKDIGYSNALTIEREISGEQQMIDIKKAINYLQSLL